MLLGYLLLALLPIAAVVYIVWTHKKKLAERNAAAAGRLQELMAATALAQNASRAAPAQAAAPQPTAAQPAAVPLYTVRERVLSPPQNLLYLLLRTGLPEHVILVRPALAAIIEAGPGLAGAARAEQERWLAATSVDFVVADRNMRPLAVVDLRASPNDAAGGRAAARTRLAAAGVRHLEFDAASLPRKDAIRALVLDGIESPVTAANSA